MIRLALPLAAAALLAAPAFATDRKVPSQFPTIAAAVAAAQSGDRILVSPNNAPGSNGVYTENVAVPNTKIGLQFVGSNVTWDGTVSDTLVVQGPGNDGVLVSGFVFRNGQRQVSITGDGATIAKCRFLNSLDNNAVTIVGNFAKIAGIEVYSCYDDGVNITGTDARVEKCKFSSIDYPGVRLTSADRAVVTGCTFDRCCDAVDLVSGVDVLLEKNTIRNDGCDGILVQGKNVRIAGNKISGVGSDNNGNPTQGSGIRILSTSEQILILGNTIENCSAYGVAFDGKLVAVMGNKVTRCGGGIYGKAAIGNGPLAAEISGNAIKGSLIYPGIELDSDAALVRKNTIEQVLNYEVGIRWTRLNASQQGGELSDNKIKNAYESGIELACDGVFALRNGVENCGNNYDGCSGLVVKASGCTISDNKIGAIAGDGLRIEGSNHTISGCVVAKCANDGIDLVSGANNTISSCTVTACLGEGFDNSNGVTNTTVQDSTFTKNRIDFAGNGNVTDTNNTYATGGPATAPQVDH